VSDTKNEMARICELLDLPFNPDFRDLFSVHRITGDSGRSGMLIETRPRRTVDTVLEIEFQSSNNYQILRFVLGFE
jgi:hypothetical protein